MNRVTNFRLKYEDKTYEVDVKEAYDLNKDIALPDGRVLRVAGWYEVYPPYPTGVTLVESTNTTPAKPG